MDVGVAAEVERPGARLHLGLAASAPEAEAEAEADCRALLPPQVQQHHDQSEDLSEEPDERAGEPGQSFVDPLTVRLRVPAEVQRHVPPRLRKARWRVRLGVGANEDSGVEVQRDLELATGQPSGGSFASTAKRISAHWPAALGFGRRLNGSIMVFLSVVRPTRPVLVRGGRPSADALGVVAFEKRQLLARGLLTSADGA